MHSIDKQKNQQQKCAQHSKRTNTEWKEGAHLCTDEHH